MTCKHVEWEEAYAEVHDTLEDAVGDVNRLRALGWDVPMPESMGDDPALSKWYVQATRERCSCERRRAK